MNELGVLFVTILRRSKRKINKSKNTPVPGGDSEFVGLKKCGAVA
jgi:hypothetical protein